MNIRFYGFEWSTTTPVPTTQFCDFLKARSGNKQNDQIIAATQIHDWTAGLLLTIKDARAYCKIKHDDHKFQVSPQELEAGTNIVDFNFFVVFPETGRGLYQHYFGSVSTRLFGIFSARRFNILKKIERDKILNADKSLSGVRRAQIRASYKDFLHTEYLMKPKTFSEYVKSLRRLDTFTCEVATYIPIKRTFQPLADKAKKQKVVFKFDPFSDATELTEHISTLADSGEFDNAAIIGFDSNEKRKEYKLYKDTQVFGEYDYDELVSTVTIDSDNLEDSIRNSAIVSQLLRVANSDQIKPLLTLRTG